MSMLYILYALIPFWLLVVIWRTCLCEAISCYFPHGNQSLHDVPCYADSIDTFCCPPRHVCLDNRLCLRTDSSPGTGNATYLRSSCTDRSWRSPECPSFCLGSTFLFRGFSHLMTKIEELTKALQMVISGAQISQNVTNLELTPIVANIRVQTVIAPKDSMWYNSMASPVCSLQSRPKQIRSPPPPL